MSLCKDHSKHCSVNTKGNNNQITCFHSDGKSCMMKVIGRSTKGSDIWMIAIDAKGSAYYILDNHEICYDNLKYLRFIQKV